jgi:PAS domain S-box-containing protein
MKQYDHYTGVERDFSGDEMIVSATDKRGMITYANSTFMRIAGYTEDELMGANHNIIRHKNMPRAAFKLVWSTLLSGQSIYAFVINRAKNGDHYWVKAFLTPVYKNGEIVEIYSYRKPINDYAKAIMEVIYKVLLDYENEHGMDATVDFLVNFLGERNLSYGEFIDRLTLGKEVTNVTALNIDTKKFHDSHLITQSNVISRAAKGEHHIEVSDPCCCEFGEWCRSVSDENMLKHSSWQSMLRAHEKVHEDLKNYVSEVDHGADRSELNRVIKEMRVDTEKVFADLQDVIDHCE